jgi:hypothetical protein
VHVSEYRDLMRHMEWADGRVWQSVLNTAPLNDDQSMRTHLHHFHATQWAYGQTLQGHPLDIPDVERFADLRSMGSWARQFSRELPVILGSSGQEEARRWAARDCRGGAFPAGTSHSAPPWAGSYAAPEGGRRAAAHRLHCLDLAWEA